MKGTLVVLGTDGSIDRTEVGNPSGLLPTLQKAVGGYVEVIPYFKTFLDQGEQKPCIALCNEEGKLNELPYNALATALWHEVLKKDKTIAAMPMVGSQLDSLVGPVVIVMGDDEFMEEF